MYFFDNNYKSDFNFIINNFAFQKKFFCCERGGRPYFSSPWDLKMENKPNCNLL